MAQLFLQRGQASRNDQFAQLGAVRGAVVFLGDSITDFGLWSEWFPQVLTSNRGVAGEVTAQMLARLHTAIDEPRAVFILGGTNDLTSGQTVDAIASRVESIVREIRRTAPTCPIFMQSVMPRSAGYAREIIALNLLLKRICAGRVGVTFVDLWPALASGEYTLRSEFTNDGLHLNGSGYAEWVAVIRAYVEKLPRDAGREPARGG